MYLIYVFCGISGISILCISGMSDFKFYPTSRGMALSVKTRVLNMSMSMRVATTMIQSIHKKQWFME